MKLDYTKNEIEMMDKELTEFVDQILIHFINTNPSTEPEGI